MSSASVRLSGTGQNTTSPTASARMPPTPSMAFRPNWGSRTSPAMSSLLPSIIGVTRRVTAPSSGRAAASNSAAAERAAPASARPSRTRPRSVLWAMAAPHSLTATGQPSSCAAGATASASCTSRSSTTGRPYSRNRALDAASDRVRVGPGTGRHATGRVARGPFVRGPAPLGRTSSRGRVAPRVSRHPAGRRRGGLGRRRRR